jgi:hypothetical protein
MTRHIKAGLIRFRAHFIAIGAIVGVLSLLDSRAGAVGLTYVDADDVGGNIAPLSAVNSGANVNDDMLWGFRAFGANTTIFESAINENSPMLTQTLTGLTPGKNYDVYGVFWTDKDENWTLQAGTSAGSLTLYSFAGDKGAPPVAASTKGITAGAAVWDNQPPPTSEGTVFTQRPADPLVMLLGRAGAATANAAGTLEVFIEDRAVVGANTRTWFDGVAYVDAGTPIALTATINRATGALTIANPTATSFQIKAVTLDSPVGALSTTGWTPISGRLDANGNQSFDTHPWTTTPPATTPFAVQLAEAEDAAGNGTGGTLAANGSISLGNVWAKTPLEDIRLSLTLADDRLVLMSPTFSGNAIVPGDFDGNGAINLADFQTLLTNLHADTAGLTTAGAYTRGDITGDIAINFGDFASFRVAYDAANGAGAFEKIAAVVPEPTAISLALVFSLAIAGRRRRLVGALSVLVLCGLTANHACAAVLLAVDVNDRVDGEAGNPTLNTVAGYQQFQLETATSTTAALPGSTRMLGNYSVTMTAVDAGGAPFSNIDDRDRAGPTTAPTFNEMYDDFIFATTGVGVGGGMDLTISGGLISPNTDYKFSLFAFDPNSTAAPQPRTSDWLDGNKGDAFLFTSSFSGADAPTTDDQYKYTATVRSDATGKLLLKGRNTLADTSPAVFVNGFLLEDFGVSIPIELTLEVNATTGALRVRNEQTVSFSMNYYEVRSASGALNASWPGLDGGEGGDPVGTGWDKAGGSDANLISEVNLSSMTSFAPAATATLGNGFSPGGAQDLGFFYAEPNGLLRAGIVKYVTGGNIVADFNGDGTVNAADLAKWKSDFGQNSGSDADGDGDSDGNDFLVWQRRLGATTATAAAVAVPEPGCVAMLVLVGGVLASARSRRRLPAS